jgi:hypothetical protein
VILLKGNHDIELHWPQVHNGHFPYVLDDAYRDLKGDLPVGPSFDDFPPELLDNLPEPKEFRDRLPEYVSNPQKAQSEEGGEKRFVFKEWFHYEKDLVYIEHGNQYEPADSSVFFLAPWLPFDPSRIELPWGGLMARYVYNKIVAVHPFAVNLKPEERIIHWMINHDLFRILGILLAEFPDVIRALGRAIQQGFRGSWIWGDRSILGLIPRLIYDLIQIWTPDMWEEEGQIRDKQNKKREEMPEYYSQEKRGAGHDLDQDRIEGEADVGPDRTELYVRFLLHLGSLGIVVSLVTAGVCWLTLQEDFEWPRWLVSLLCLSGALTLAGTVWGIIWEKSDAGHTLGEVLLQLGCVGLVGGLIADLLIAGGQWPPSALLLVPVFPLILAVVGGLLICAAGETWEDAFAPRLFRGDEWPAKAIHSSASLLKELSLASFIAFVFFFLKGMESTQWLLSAGALFVCGWLASYLYTVYVNRWRLDRVVERWLNTCQRRARTVANMAVGLLSTAVLLGLIASVVKNLLKDVEGVETVVCFAGRVDEFIVEPKLVGDVPLLVGLFVALGAVVLFQIGISQFLQKLGDGPLRRWVLAFRDKSDTRASSEERYVLDGDLVDRQLAAIQELARAEQRRWAGSLLKALTLLLPLLSVFLLVIALGALATTVDAVMGPITTITATLGLTVVSSVAYWVLRQFSAATHRHDPASGWGDLFYRMAVNIADILDEDQHEKGHGLGHPRYFVFGHDHWADSKLIQDSIRKPSQEPSKKQRRWYANSGTWLRGYVEEQRRQEVNDNHSTFVQIIPGLGEDEAPRVLRWNDSANQPERIVRREEPRSAGSLLWDRWEQEWLRVLVWMILLAASSLVFASELPGAMDGLRPIAWAFGWWVLIGFVESLWDWLKRWKRYWQEAPSQQSEQ